MAKKKILIGAGCIAGGIALVSSVSYAVTKKLVKFALDREKPQEIAKKSHVAGKVKIFEEFQIYREQMSKQLQSKECDTVEIMSHDGVKLVGHWWSCENAKRVIIAMHGWRSSWSRDFGMMADFWHNNNCSVLFVEQRAQNNSDGEYMSFGMWERYDCLDWIKWVNEHIEEKLPIYLNGMSMGAATVLMTTGLELPENIHGVVADCGFTSVEAIWKHVVNDMFHMPYNGVAANTLCKKRIHVGTKEYSTKDALSKNKLPILFIHGADDDFVPIEMTYENYKICTAPKQLYVVPGAGHAMSYYIGRDGYEKATKDFWDAYDMGSEKIQTKNTYRG